MFSQILSLNYFDQNLYPMYTQSTSYTYDQSGTELTLVNLDSGIMTQGGTGSGMAQQSTTVLRGLNQGLGVVFPQVQQQIAPLAAVGNFDSVFSAVDYFELARSV